MVLRRGFWLFGLIMFFLPVSVWGEKYTEEEVSLSKVPKVNLSHPNLRRVFRKMAKEYRRLYAKFAADGLILPNELSELNFQRRIIKWVVAIDREYRLTRVQIERIKRKLKRGDRSKREELMRELRELEKKRERYREMIYKYSCRYLDNYRRKNRGFCKKLFKRQ